MHVGVGVAALDQIDQGRERLAGEGAGQVGRRDGAGGQDAGIPKGLIIEEPYDSLSLVPTLLTLTGQIKDGRLSESLEQRGFWAFPGGVVEAIHSGG